MMSVTPQSTATSVEPATTEWWLFVIWGAASVVLGALILLEPIASAIVLLTIVAMFWLIGGIADIIGALGHRTGQWLWRVGGGVLSVIVALFVLAHPIVGTVAAVSVLYLLIATSALLTGVIGLFSGKRSLGRIVLSVLQVILAGLMLIGFLDIVNLKLLVQAIGLLGIGGGIVAAMSAFHFKSRAPAHT
jgi:uncharacterized membrane protein HdeD (DUF308 family)